MSNEAIQNLIIEHALASEANLEVACAVHAAFENIREKIVLKFLKRLEPILRETLGNEWDVRADFVYTDREYRVLTLGKNAWIDACPIQLRVDGKVREPLYIGISKEQTPFTILSQQAEDQIRASLARKFGIKSNEGWVAYWYVQDKKYSVWSDSQTLKNMYFRTDDFVSYFKDLVSAWAKTLAPALD